MRKKTSHSSFLLWILLGAILAGLTVSAKTFWMEYQLQNAIEERTELEKITINPAQPNQVYPSWLYHEIKPGETTQDNILIASTYKEEKAVEIGILDAKGDYKKVDSENPFEILEDSHTAVGAWITFDTNDLKTLEKNDLKKLGLTIKVPETTPEGEYVGVTYVQYKGPDMPTDEGWTHTQARVGLRTIIKVTQNPMPREELTQITPFQNKTTKRYILMSAMITFLALGAIVAIQLKKSK